MSDDDRIWLETLAGVRTGGDSAAEREAADLRRAMLARSVDESEAIRRIEDPNRVDQLLERARREGVTRLRPRARFAWLAGWPGALATAAVCLLAIGLGFEVGDRKPSVPSETVRDASPHAFLLTASDPSRLRDQIADELDAAGVSTHLYQTLGRAGIDADLPDPLPEAVRVVLARHGVPVPADGVLRLEVAGPAP